jgi:hypothetical protein
MIIKIEDSLGINIWLTQYIYIERLYHHQDLDYTEYKKKVFVCYTQSNVTPDHGIICWNIVISIPGPVLIIVILVWVIFI